MKRIVIGLTCLIVVATAGDASARTHHRRSLTNYMKMYWSWAYGVNQPDHLGEVVFVPTPPTATYDPVTKLFFGETGFTMGRDDSFFLPIFAFVGENHGDGSPDDSPSIISKSDFTSSDVQITLDGRPLIDADDLDDFYVDTTYFHPPIVYAPPALSSGLWVKGLGFLHAPLSKGHHTLLLHITSQWLFDNFGYWGWENTWHFTITK